MSCNRFELKMMAVVAALGATVPFAASAQTVVYDNSTGVSTGMHVSNVEYGDEITLAGSLRTATQFSFSYFSNFDSAQSGVLRIYANDGVIVSGSPSPSTVLYQSAAFDIVKSNVSDPNNVQGSTVSINLSGTGLVLPDKVTWTVTLAGVGGGNSAGLLVYGGPTTGTSKEDFWKKTAGTWSLQLLDNNVSANFGAKLTAIPEPSTYALAGVGAIGWLALAGYRRSKK